VEHRQTLLPYAEIRGSTTVTNRGMRGVTTFAASCSCLFGG